MAQLNFPRSKTESSIVGIFFFSGFNGISVLYPRWLEDIGKSVVYLEFSLVHMES